MLTKTPTRTLATTLLGAAVACAAALASADGSAMVPEFSELDSNGDGALDRSEWMNSPAASTMGEEMAMAHYEMYDVDENGSVSGDEYAEVNRETFEQMEEAI